MLSTHGPVHSGPKWTAGASRISDLWISCRATRPSSRWDKCHRPDSTVACARSRCVSATAGCITRRPPRAIAHPRGRNRLRCPCRLLLRLWRDPPPLATCPDVDPPFCACHAQRRSSLPLTARTAGTAPPQCLARHHLLPPSSQHTHSRLQRPLLCRRPRWHAAPIATRHDAHRRPAMTIVAARGSR